MAFRMASATVRGFWKVVAALSK
jgi:hypothetical protein